jgi:hypothetical protein
MIAHRGQDRGVFPDRAGERLDYSENRIGLLRNASGNIPKMRGNYIGDADNTADDPGYKTRRNREVAVYDVGAPDECPA